MNEIVDLEGEIWKPVVGFEGKYEVSNKGRVKSLNFNKTSKKRIMKQNFTKQGGYLFVNLCKDGKHKGYLVHRLVYNAFVGILPRFVVSQKGDDRMEINHINEIKTDNRLENLELVTCRKNNNHGTHNIRSAMHRRHKVYQYTKDNSLLKIWDNIMSLRGSEYSQHCVYRACANIYNKNTNVYRGYIWSYIPIAE